MRIKIKDFFFFYYFFTVPKHVVVHHLNCLNEAILMKIPQHVFLQKKILTKKS